MIMMMIFFSCPSDIVGLRTSETWHGPWVGDDDDDDTRLKPDSRLAEWVSHFQEQQLQLFVAIRKQVESVCVSNSLSSVSLHC